jgi:hypothetical protein
MLQNYSQQQQQEDPLQQQQVVEDAIAAELDSSWSEATEIVSGLFVGSARAANDLSMLRRKRIGAVLSAGTKFTAGMYTRHRDVVAEHLVVTAKDVPEQNLLAFWNDTNAWLARQLDERGARVLVHCQKGMSRSASIAAAFLVAHRNMSLDAALGTLKARRAIVAPNRGFLRQLRYFEDLHARLWWPQSDDYLRFVATLTRVDRPQQ